MMENDKQLLVKATMVAISACCAIIVTAIVMAVILLFTKVVSNPPHHFHWHNVVSLALGIWVGNAISYYRIISRG